MLALNVLQTVIDVVLHFAEIFGWMSFVQIHLLHTLFNSSIKCRLCAVKDSFHLVFDEFLLPGFFWISF